MIGSAWRRWVIALAFLLPNLAGFLVFTAGPVVFSLAMSFTDWALTKHNRFSETPVRWIGVENYRRILGGDEAHFFWDYFGNTLFLMLGIPIGIAGSLGLALMLHADPTPRTTRGRVRCGALALVVTVIAAAGTWAVTTPGVPSAADAPLAAMSGEAGLTDLSRWQVANLRSHAAVAAVGALGFVATASLVFGSIFLRGLFYLPSLLAGVAMFLLWKTLYRPEGGLINAGLGPLLEGLQHSVGVTPPLLWRSAGLALAGASVGLGLRSLIVGGSRLMHRDCGPAGFVGRVGLTAALAAIGVGVAVVVWSLPEAARAGLEPPLWLVDARWAKTALIIMGFWAGIGGGTMLLYLAGLSNIPPELYEAASIDGATGWQRFVHVTWPQLAPTTFFIVIMATIGGLQGGFEQAMVMTQGKADTIVLAYYIYNVAFTDQFELGLASAIAWVMFAMIFALTAVNFRLGSQLTNE
jgi:multiple sugar transport system permease protein